MTDTNKSVDTRVELLEANVNTLTDDVRSLATSVRQWMDARSQEPRPIPFKEIMVTVAVTLGVVATVLGYLDTQADRKFALYKYRLETLEKMAVLRRHPDMAKPQADAAH